MIDDKIGGYAVVACRQKPAFVDLSYCVSRDKFFAVCTDIGLNDLDEFPSSESLDDSLTYIVVDVNISFLDRTEDIQFENLKTLARLEEFVNSGLSQEFTVYYSWLETF